MDQQTACIGDIVLIDSLFWGRYEARVVAIGDPGYEYIERRCYRVKAVQGIRRIMPSKWVEWFQVDGIVRRAAVVELEKLYQLK